MTQTQLAAMTRDHMLDRVRRFLTERSTDPGLLSLLASGDDCRRFWSPWYEQFADMDEHGLAVRLSYLLAARAHDLDADLATVPGQDGEIAMKCLLEDRGILPFIAFDQG